MYYSRANITDATSFFDHKVFDCLEGAVIGLAAILGNHEYDIT